jgi:hypothetical protein
MMTPDPGMASKCGQRFAQAYHAAAAATVSATFRLNLKKRAGIGLAFGVADAAAGAAAAEPAPAVAAAAAPAPAATVGARAAIGDLAAGMLSDKDTAGRGDARAQRVAPAVDSAACVRAVCRSCCCVALRLPEGRVPCRACAADVSVATTGRVQDNVVRTRTVDT